MFSHWQLGRQAAHMSLTSLRELFSTNSDSPSPRVIRIGQLDSELLDQDLVTLLQEPVNKALSLINARIPILVFVLFFF
jgi:peroxin-2